MLLLGWSRFRRTCRLSRFVLEPETKCGKVCSKFCNLYRENFVLKMNKVPYTVPNQTNNKNWNKQALQDAGGHG